MHPYSVDSIERKWIPVIILFISIILVILIRGYTENFFSSGFWSKYYLITSIIVDVSVILIYEIIYGIFNRWLWKIPYMPFVKVPDLNGTWKGTLESSFTDENSKKIKKNATIKISQNWQNIEIQLKTDTSKSKTVAAAFLTKNQDSIELTYQYLGDPNPITADPSMHIHRGTGWITLNSDKKCFEGDYYNGRDNHNYGILKFKKMEID